MNIWDEELQLKRRNEVRELHRKYCFELYNDRGEFVPSNGYDWRAHLWHAMSFLEGDERYIRKANAMLLHVTEKENIDITSPGHNSNFWGSAAVMVLARYGDRLTQEAGNVIREKVGALLKPASNFMFKGYNDNYPAMSAVIALR